MCSEATTYTAFFLLILVGYTKKLQFFVDLKIFYFTWLELNVKFKCLKLSIKLAFGKSAFSPHFRFNHDQEMLSVITAHMGTCLTF